MRVKARCAGYARGRWRVAVVALAPEKKFAQAEEDLRAVLGSVEVFGEAEEP